MTGGAGRCCTGSAGLCQSLAIDIGWTWLTTTLAKPYLMAKGGKSQQIAAVTH